MRAILIAVLGAVLACGAAAQERPFTVGTGADDLTYAPVARVISEAMASVAGLDIQAVTSPGSLDNIAAIADGTRASGFAQSDIAYWAYDGTGIWSGRPPVAGLRTIAALYEEHIHLVALADGDIESVADLRGKRISLDEVGSGTHVDARLILEAAGLRSDEFGVEVLKGMAAADALVEGRIDAFFTIAGYPTAAITDLSRRAPIRIVPIDGDLAVELAWRHGFLAVSEIPDGTYEGVPGVGTVSVGAHWYTSEAVDEDVIYAITRALFDETTQRRLVEGHPKGAEITADTALDGVAVPLHPGAVRYYEDAGIME